MDRLFRVIYPAFTELSIVHTRQAAPFAPARALLGSSETSSLGDDPSVSLSSLLAFMHARMHACLVLVFPFLLKQTLMFPPLKPYPFRELHDLRRPDEVFLSRSGRHSESNLSLADD